MLNWIETQIGRFMNFLMDAKEDIADFDEHVQEEIAKYNNKQCGKAAIVGTIIGVAGTLAVQALLRTF